MDRDITLGNRVIANYMQQRQKNRLKQRIKHIKTNKSQYSSLGLIKDKPRTSSMFLQKNQQIQKQNISMFNRIASIIKKTPKNNTQQSTESLLLLQKSRQTSMIWNRKTQSSLELQNKLIQKRLLNQKPTINNKSFYQQRTRHLQYLKNISKYPYILNNNKQLKTQPDDNSIIDDMMNVTQLPLIVSSINSNSNGNHNNVNNNNSLSKNKFIGNNNNNGDKNQIMSSNSVRQLFKHSSLDFTITLSMDLKQDICTFSIENNANQLQKYTLTIPKTQFVTYFEQSDYDYQKMVANLRLNDDGKIVYIMPQVQNSNNIKHHQSNSSYKQQAFKCRAQSTAYTSNGFKYGFRTSKRHVTEKNQNKVKQTCKTDRKANTYLKTGEKYQTKKENDSISENKFSDAKYNHQIKLFQKN